MTALRIVEDHGRFLRTADGGSDTGYVAVRSRWVVAAICVLIALGLLLCTERASLAQQMGRGPDPATPKAPQGPMGQRAENAPVAPFGSAPPRAERPARGQPTYAGPASPPAERPTPPGPAVQAGVPRAEHGPPVSRPTPRPPVEHGAPVGQGKPIEEPGGQGTTPPGHVPREHPQGSSRPSPKPVHVPKEHPQGHSRGPQKPVGQEDPDRPHPSKPVDQNEVSPPEKQNKPEPNPTNEPSDPQGNPQGAPNGDDQGNNPQGGKDTSGNEGTEPDGQQGGSKGLPEEKENHTPGNGSAEAPGQSEKPADHGTVTKNEPDIENGQLPTAIVTGSNDGGTGGGTGYEDTGANTPENGLASGTSEGQRPDHRAASVASSSREPGSSDTRWAKEPSRPPAKAAADTTIPHPTTVRGKGSARTAEGPSPQIGARHSQAVRTPPPAAPGDGGRPPAGYGTRASESSFGSTGYFFGYLWDEGGNSVQQDRGGLGVMRKGPRDVAATKSSHGGALTPRAPPLPVPSPFSGFGLTMGGAVFGASSSSDGYAPLLAVIFCCLAAVVWRGRSRAYGALLRAGTVPRLALERPG